MFLGHAYFHISVFVQYFVLFFFPSKMVLVYNWACKITKFHAPVGDCVGRRKVGWIYIFLGSWKHHIVTVWKQCCIPLSHQKCVNPSSFLCIKTVDRLLDSPWMFLSITGFKYSGSLSEIIAVSMVKFRRNHYIPIISYVHSLTWNRWWGRLVGFSLYSMSKSI